MRFVVVVHVFLAFGLLAQAPSDLVWGFRAHVNGRELGFSTDASAVQFSRDRTTFSLGATLAVRVDHAADGDGVRISATLENTSNKPATLGRVILADQADPALKGAHFLAMSGWQLASRVKQAAPGTTLTSKVVTQIFDPKSNRYWHAGFLSFDAVSTVHELTSTQSGEANLRSICDFEGYKLLPGRSVTTEQLWLAPGLHLADWAERVQERYKPKLPARPPSGWVGWSWVDPFNVERYEDVALRNARAIRSRLPGLPIDFLWVSLGNLPDRRPGAWLEWNTKLFPSGPESFVQQLRAMNFQPGLWSGAFWLNSGLRDEVEKLRPAFLMKDGKPLTVPHRDLGEMYILDPTHPLTAEHLRRAFTEYRRWGIRYYMIDFLNAIGGSTPGTYQPSGYADANAIPGPAPYRQGLKIIRDAAGPDTFLLSSTGPTFWNIGLVDGIRAGSDYGEGRPLDGPGKGFWPATFVINNPKHWTSHRTATDALASHSFLHRRLFWSDAANVLTVGPPVPMADAQISATIFGISGGQIMLGDEIPTLPAERLRLLRLVFPRSPESATALDLFTAAEPDYPKVFHLPVRTAWDEWNLYAVFNYGQEPLTKSLPVKGSAVAWDFWNERYLGGSQDRIEVVVPPESVRLVRVTAQRPHPWLIGTNLNVRQGQTDIESCVWNAADRRLEIAYRAWPEQEGAVFVHAPKGWSVANPLGLAIAKDANDESLVIAVPVRQQTGKVSIAFNANP